MIASFAAAASLVLGALFTTNGVPVGDDAATLIAQRGTPLYVETDGAFDTYAYLYGSADVLQFVTMRDERVIGFSLEPLMESGLHGGAEAPNIDGIHLGDRVDALPKTLPAGEAEQTKQTPQGPLERRSFEFSDHRTVVFSHDGTITGLLLTISPMQANALHAAPKPQLPDGTSPQSAVVLKAATDKIGVRSEYIYIAHTKCGDSGSYKAAGQKLLTQEHRAFDVLHAKCSDGTQERDFFFDITDFYGKY